MLRMKIQYREFMYFGFTVMVPPMMLFKSPFTHAAIAYVISIVIFLYDPVVKGIRKAINYTNFYYVSCVGLGFVLGGINRAIDGGLFLNFVWLIYYFITSHRFLDKFESYNSKHD